MKRPQRNWKSLLRKQNGEPEKSLNKSQRNVREELYMSCNPEEKREAVASEAITENVLVHTGEAPEM